MSERFRVRVTKDQLAFCSGHFITFAGSQCERLHGHNYRVAVEVEGPLDENQYVFDFIALKELTQQLTAELDHRMLLPTRSQSIRVTEEGMQVTARYGDRHWSFPREDCVLLPIANTTAELLAGYLARQLREKLAAQYRFTPALLAVEVEESPGQAARYEWRSPG